MTAKIVTLVLTLLINIAIGIAVLLFMLIAMNGYSESDSTPGLLTFIVLTLVIAIATSLAGFLISGSPIERGFKPLISSLIAVPVFSAFGALLIIVASLIGISVSEYVRVNY